MSTSFLRSRKTLYVAIGILALTGGGWAVARMAKSKKPAVPKDLTVEALQKAATDPGKAFEKVHEAMRNSNLTEEQRHQVMENAHTVMEVQMDKRLDEYFTAPDEKQRVAILDKQIDEMQVHMKDWEKRRAEREKERAARPANSGSTGGTPSATGGSGTARGPQAGPGAPGPRGDHRGGPHAEPTRQQRKERFESRNPDSQARRMAYFTAMRKRAQERGIQMPGFMGRGPGGPGGGRP